MIFLLRFFALISQTLNSPNSLATATHWRVLNFEGTFAASTAKLNIIKLSSNFHILNLKSSGLVKINLYVCLNSIGNRFIITVLSMFENSNIITQDHLIQIALLASIASSKWNQSITVVVIFYRNICCDHQFIVMEPAQVHCILSILYRKSYTKFFYIDAIVD